MKRSNESVVIVGGGVWIVELLESLATHGSLPPLEVVLVAQRADRLRTICRHAARRVAPLPGSIEIRGSTCLRDALVDAKAVVLLARIGGLDARRHDESFPQRRGLVGDEGLSVGGFANAWRTLPVLQAMATEIGAVAPHAAVLNMMAPLGMTTRCLLDAGLDATGLCELPAVTRDRWTRAAEARGGFEPERAAEGSPRLPSATRSSAALPVLPSPALEYAGLNHLGFFWPVAPEGHALIAAALAEGDVAPEVHARFGATPLHYYDEVFEPDVAERLGRRRKPNRAQELLDLDRAALEAMSDRPGAEIPELSERSMPWFEEALVPALAARFAGIPHDGFANVRNQGHLPGLPEETVIELEADFGSEGVTVRPPSTLPPRVEHFLQGIARAEAHAYTAARSHEPAGLQAALQALPLSLSIDDRRFLTHQIVRGPVSGAQG
jgi:6-phospho-beta-glucosidase